MSIQETLRNIEEKFLKKGIPDFNVGDIIKMTIKAVEADKIRLHPFEGIVIRKTGRGLRGTFTVRKVSFGEGVERVFPIHSPTIATLKIISRGETRRARLYYLREKIGKKGRIKQTQVTEQAAPAA